MSDVVFFMCNLKLNAPFVMLGNWEAWGALDLAMSWTTRLSISMSLNLLYFTESSCPPLASDLSNMSGASKLAATVRNMADGVRIWPTSSAARTTSPRGSGPHQQARGRYAVEVDSCGYHVNPNGLWCKPLATSDSRCAASHTNVALRLMRVLPSEL
eukprot:CAMPEP_0115870362 /NCGR_PEP_ID=MMETSP0287-20121206/22286_1 /TAXON_ID=412157 /ORGANISM="Chrysochromulina rotalis, Strain UIO044" /LENGTH=156 /DNA_ID=CAMNT_0003325079 /DNA_START=48 /DNA_END=516 /DNA_ORIENTATION=+